MQPFDVPHFIQEPAGVTLLDALPILSLFPCCTTLDLFRRTRRYTDLFLFSTGFVLAVVYHWCQAHPEGLDASQFLGIGGVYWRTFDVILCLILLTRTMGHIFNAISFPFSMLPNIIFPVALIAMCATSTKVEMSSIVILCLFTMLTTALSVTLLRQKPLFVTYRPFEGRFIFSCFYSAGFFLFLPNLFGRYWLFHSLWHLFLAAGYHILYNELERKRLSPQLFAEQNGKEM